MRISCDKDDEGYRQFLVAKEHGKKVLVFLDGVEVRYCNLADTDQGFVERCVLGADGMIQVDPVDNNKVWTEIVTGTVEVRFE